MISSLRATGYCAERTDYRPARRAGQRFAWTTALLTATLVTGGGAMAWAEGDNSQGAAGAASVSEGSLSWGYKESFRRYVGAQTAAMPPIGALPEGERITVHDGATFDTAGKPAIADAKSNPNETLPYTFPVTGGSYTDFANFTIDAGGKAAYHFPSHAFEASISNLSLVVSGGAASLVGDMVVDVTENAFGYAPGHHGGTDVTIATTTGINVTPSADGTALSVEVSGLKATQAASQAMNGFLSEGEVLDELKLQVALSATPTPTPDPDASQVPVEVAIPEGQPEPEPGALTMTVDTSSAVSLGTATAGQGGYISTGALHPVTVKDTREGGPGWRVTGVASVFSSANASFAASHLGWTPKVTAPGAGAVAGASVTPGSAAGAGLAQAVTLASANAGHELGSTTLGADLALSAPLDTPAGSYAATLTLTVIG